MNIINFLKLILSKGKTSNPYLDPHYDQNTTYYKTISHDTFLWNRIYYNDKRYYYVEEGKHIKVYLNFKAYYDSFKGLNSPIDIKTSCLHNELPWPITHHEYICPLTKIVYPSQQVAEAYLLNTYNMHSWGFVEGSTKREHLPTEFAKNPGKRGELVYSFQTDKFKGQTHSTLFYNWENNEWKSYSVGEFISAGYTPSFGVPASSVKTLVKDPFLKPKSILKIKGNSHNNSIEPSFPNSNLRNMVTEKNVNSLNISSEPLLITDNKFNHTFLNFLNWISPYSEFFIWVKNVFTQIPEWLLTWEMFTFIFGIFLTIIYVLLTLIRLCVICFITYKIYKNREYIMFLLEGIYNYEKDKLLKKKNNFFITMLIYGIPLFYFVFLGLVCHLIINFF